MKDELVEVEVWHEVGDERVHLFMITECQERN